MTYKNDDYNDFNKKTALFKETISSRFNITEMTNEEVRSRYTILCIFYDKLETTEITQSPKMTIFDLISSIGGILGN